MIAEVETAKALVELPSPYAGVVAELLAARARPVPVGDRAADIAVGGAGEARRGRGSRLPSRPARARRAAGYVRPSAERRPRRLRAAAESGRRPAPRRTVGDGGPAAPSADADAGSGPGAATGTRPRADPAGAQARPRPRRRPRQGARQRQQRPGHPCGRRKAHRAARVRPPRLPRPRRKPSSRRRWLAGRRRPRRPGFRSQACARRRPRRWWPARSPPRTATVFLTVDVTRDDGAAGELRADHAFAGHRLTPLVLAAKAL